MFGSVCTLMVTNVIFFKMLLSVLSNVPSGLDIIPWIVLVLTIVKVARKADAIITRIGLNPAITGDSLGRGFPGTLTYMVMRSATSHIMQMEEQEARLIQDKLNLSEDEVRQITRFRRGEVLLCIGYNHVPVAFHTTPKEYEAITTSPTDLRRGRSEYGDE